MCSGAAIFKIEKRREGRVYVSQLITKDPKPVPRKETKTQPLAVHEGLRHGLPQRLRQQKRRHTRQESRHAEEAGRVAPQQQQVRRQHRADAADDPAAAHPHPPHHRGELLGAEQIEDGVGTVAGKAPYNRDGDAGGGEGGRDEGVGEEGEAGQDQEHAHGVLAPEGGSLQREDDVDVAGQLNGRRHQEPDIFVLE
jgi:hypothetical protein